MIALKNTSIARMNLFVTQGSLNQSHTQSGTNRAMSEHQVLLARAATCSCYTHAYRHDTRPYKAFCGFHMEIVSRACWFSISYLCTAIYSCSKVYAKCLL